MSHDQDIKTTVEKMAKLANLHFPSDQLEKFAEKARSVIAYVNELQELDTTGIEPTSHAAEASSILRPDEAVPSTLAKEILNAAPERDGAFVQVPKVIDSE